MVAPSFDAVPTILCRARAGIVIRALEAVKRP
jgi:hypothetical protein